MAAIGACALTATRLLAATGSVSKRWPPGNLALRPLQQPVTLSAEQQAKVGRIAQSLGQVADQQQVGVCRCGVFPVIDQLQAKRRITDLPA